MMNNIILGYGINAKIFAFYNPEYKIIGKNNSATKDKVAGKFITLQDNPYNIKFLKDLEFRTGKNINYKLVDLDVKYYNQENNCYENTVSQEIKRALIDKKLTDSSGKKIEFKHPLFLEELKLACEDECHKSKVIDVDMETINSLLEEVTFNQLISDFDILKIDLDKKEIFVRDYGWKFNDAGEREIFETEICYKYNDCVCTVPLPAFLSYCGIKTEEFVAFDTTVIESDEKELGIPFIDCDSIVYFPQENFPFTRVNKIHGKCYADITGDTEKFKQKSVMKNSRIQKRSVNFILPNIMLLGRFSEWNPDLRIQDVIRKSSSKIVMHNLWNNQKAFSSKFFDFEQDIDLVQTNIKELSLLMMDEVFELLKKINWKKHSSKKIKLSLSEIKEEWVDIFKYWLTIGNNLGIGFEEFLDKYEEKSESLIKNEKKFKVLDNNESKIN